MADIRRATGGVVIEQMIHNTIVSDVLVIGVVSIDQLHIDGKSFRTIWLASDGWAVEIIDQTKLPHEFIKYKAILYVISTINI